MQFRFGDQLIDIDRRELWRGRELIALEPQVFDVLVYLVQNRDRVVSKDDLLAAVWGGRIVSDSALTSRITAVRKAIGDDGRTQRLIRTMPRKGVRFVAVVEEEQKPAAPADGPAMVAADLPRPALALPDKPSIAVLPFANLTGNRKQDYFADGMVEEIITALSKMRWFLVIARYSTLAYKGETVDVKEVGRALGVRYVLEGSVRKSGNRIRVAAQLIDAASGNHIWAERYDRELADIFAVQDEITERVVAAIEPELYAAEHFCSQRKPPESLDAWECVIRALSHLGQLTPTGYAEAESLCRRAIAIAPGYGQAHSLLAWALVRRTSRTGGNVKAVLQEAAAEAQTALDLDERDPWAHAWQGMVLWRRHRYSEAVRALRRALELNPNFALAHALVGLPLAVQGAHDDAIASAEHALRLSPSERLVGVYALHAMTVVYFGAARYADCMSCARRVIERSSDHIAAHYLLIAAAAIQGDTTVAVATRADLLRLRPDFSVGWLSENFAYSGEIGERLLDGLRSAGVPEVSSRPAA